MCSALTSPYVTLDRALAVTAVCISILALTKKFCIPKTFTARCAYASLAVLFLLGSMTQELVIPTDTLCNRLKNSGFKMNYVANTRYYELSHEASGITRVACFRSKQRSSISNCDYRVQDAKMAVAQPRAIAKAQQQPQRSALACSPSRHKEKDVGIIGVDHTKA